MFKTGLLLSVCTALVLATPAAAAPSPLIIDKNVRPKSSNGRINAVHKEIPTMSADLNKVRYGILEGMLETKGFSWVYDGEGEGYILARFDYRGDTNVMRIEYNENYVQLKYQDALGDYVCEKLIEGICYKNGRGYYNYIKNLRKSIAHKIERL